MNLRMSMTKTVIAAFCEVSHVSSGEFISAAIAEAVLAIWRHRPHRARFNRHERFGALHHTIFVRDLNGAQVIIDALLLRHAENCRIRPALVAGDAYGLARGTGRSRP